MGPGSHAEIERKYDVGEDVIAPALHGLSHVARASEPSTLELDAVYYDTPQLALATAGITLRRRRGGEDAGWHLKLPVSQDHRSELRVPLGAGEEPVPEPLLDRVRVHVRDHAVVPVARIRTRRVVSRLLDDHGDVLAEFCDDHVSADRLLPEARSLRWREWEVELVGGPLTLLDDVSILLTRVGASPAAGPSKLSRVLGGSTGDVVTATGDRSGTLSAGQALQSYLKDQVSQLERQDPLVREGAADSVHKMRVAARRLRSALATYRPILVRGSGEHLRDELSWLGGQLGQARDTEVMRERINALLEELPHEPVLVDVVRVIDRELATRYESGLANAREALDSKRYFRLLDALDGFVAAPPFTGVASRPASREMPDLLNRDWKRLRGAAQAVGTTPGPRERDLALHEVRKAAKRLRYAAESAAPVLGERAVMLAATSEGIQDVLGKHHDTAVTRETLRTLGVQAHLGDESGLAVSRLLELEEVHARQFEEQYSIKLRELPTSKLRTWLQD